MYAPLARSLALATLAIGFAAFQVGAQSKSSSVCKDGTTSSVAGRGACSGHGGVDSVATAANRKSTKAAKAEAKAEKADKGKDPAKKAKADAKAAVATTKADKAEAKAAKDSIGATAQCKDGTYTHAVLTKYQCTNHGGVGKSFKAMGKP